jgi:hypothetical protein
MRDAQEWKVKQQQYAAQAQQLAAQKVRDEEYYSTVNQIQQQVQAGKMTPEQAQMAGSLAFLKRGSGTGAGAAAAIKGIARPEVKPFNIPRGGTAIDPATGRTIATGQPYPVAPRAPVRVNPGETVIDPTTGKPMYTAPARPQVAPHVPQGSKFVPEKDGVPAHWETPVKPAAEGAMTQQQKAKLVDLRKQKAALEKLVDDDDYAHKTSVAKGTTMKQVSEGIQAQINAVDAQIDQIEGGSAAPAEAAPVPPVPQNPIKIKSITPHAAPAGAPPAPPGMAAPAPAAPRAPAGPTLAGRPVRTAPPATRPAAADPDRLLGAAFGNKIAKTGFIAPWASNIDIRKAYQAVGDLPDSDPRKAPLKAAVDALAAKNPSWADQ